MARAKDDLVLLGKETPRPTKKHVYHGYMPKTAEENWLFNIKKPIPDGWEIYYKDGNPKNWTLANLGIRPKKGTPVVKEEEKPAEKPAEPKKPAPKPKK